MSHNLQIKLYSEFGGKPHTWDQSQKGIVIFSPDTNTGEDKVMKFMSFSMKLRTFIALSWTEYIFVTMSVALVVAKFFPAVHNQIVSRATRPEHQSLYWGTAVVSNIFTYGLVFAAERGCSIYRQMECLDNIQYSYRDAALITAIPGVQEVIVTVILFAGALIATFRYRNRAGITIPTGMAKFVILISFCWSTVCCCFCCSPKFKAKTVKFLVMFSFMVFIHRNIMEVISLAFMLFIAPSRVIVVTMAFLTLGAHAQRGLQ